MRILPFALVAVAVTAAFAGIAEASGGLQMAEKWSWTRDGGRIVNAVVVLGAVAWLVIKFGKPALERRAELIAEKFDSLEKARKDAAAKLEEYKKKLVEIEAEAEKVRVNAKAEGETIRKKIVEQAERTADQIVEKASERIALETQNAREKLRMEATAAAVEMAEEIIKKNLGPEDQKRLVKEYLERVEKLN